MEETGVVGIPWWGLPVWGCQIPWVRCRTWPSLGTIACLSRTFSYVLCVHSDNRVSRVSREVSSVRALCELSLCLFVRKRSSPGFRISDSPHSVSNDGSAAPGQHKYREYSLSGGLLNCC